MTTQVAADLRAAADILRKDGWTQEIYGRPTGCKCLYGAIHFVATDGDGVSDVDLTKSEQRRADLMDSAVMAHLGIGSYLGLLDWNDDETRTADEVIAALEAAAANAEQQA